MLMLEALSSPRFKTRRGRNRVVVAAIALSKLLPRRPSLSCCRKCVSLHRVPLLPYVAAADDAAEVLLLP
jgi:hypothetical protein